MSEFLDKVESVRTLLVEKDLKAAVVRRNPNLGWLIAGRVHVPSTLDLACFDLVITSTDVYAVTNTIEGPRLIAEEFPSGLEVRTVNWWEARDQLLPSGSDIGSDQAGGERTDIGIAVEELRQKLSGEEVSRLRTVSADTARALGNALKESRTEDREIDVAGRITQALWRENLEVVFLGVAGSSRVRRFRHPLPTDSIIGGKVVASVCARRKGLISSVTRIVTFGAVSTAEEAEYRDLLNVEAAMFDATVVGQPFSAPVRAAIAAYATNNFEADEWHHHHQGGPTGYLPRDWPATPSSSRLIVDNQAIAWNPTGKGWKVEDTIVASNSGIDIMSTDSTWPSIDVAGRNRPYFLAR